VLYVRLITACLLTLPFVNAVAQDSGGDDEEALRQLYGDEEMISIATGRLKPINKAPAVATVITAKDIEAIGATDLDEVLETVPGLHVARNFIGYNPVYTFRGIYSDTNPQVLMLINDVPITNLFLGDRNQIWGGMPVEDIARIEIIRGPGSAIYGADAFAGVINIITKTKQDINGTEFGVRAGSFDFRDAWLLHGGAWRGFDVAIYLEYQETDGQREPIDADAQTGVDTVFGTDASLAPGPVNLERHSVDARLDIARGHWRLRAGLQRRRNVANGAGVAQALDPNNRYASDRWNMDLTYHNPHVRQDWDVTAQVSYLDTTEEIQEELVLFPPGTVLPIDSDGNINPVDPAGLVTFTDGLIGNPEVFERHYRINGSAFYNGFDDHLVRIGAGITYSDLYKTKESKNFGPGVIDGTDSPIDGNLTNVSDTPFVFLPEDHRKNYYFFLQDEWNFARDWELTTGIRYDDYSDFGDTVNPRLALVWSAQHNLTAKLLYGRGFRAPSFAEMRNQNNPVNVGNPDVEPETIDSIELAFDLKPTAMSSLALSLFRYRWDDIILFVQEPGTTTRTAQNAGKQTGYGLELDARWQPTRTLRLLGNYAYQRSTDEKTDKDAGNAPHHQMYLRADWEFLPNWHFHPQLNWVIDRDRVAGDTRAAIDDYSTVDLVIRTERVKRHWEFALSVRNLFDTDRREPSPPGSPIASIPNDLPLAGRRFLAEMRWHF